MRLNTNHLSEEGVSYFEHILRAFPWLLKLCKASACLLIHMVCPFILTDTASKIISDLNAEIQDRKCN